MIGQTVSHYRVVEKLGGGGMGVVYRAEDTRLRRSVALKVLPPDLTRDDDAKRRFILEAQAASALDHPNICAVHEIDETPDGQLFLVLAYCDGETLKKKIERGPLKLDDALDIGVQIAQGLVKAHAAGIVHRDIKPGNVMLTSDGLVKIVDFGLAKLLGGTGMTGSGTTLGTAPYMSPEQTLGEEVDARSDLWSLGVVLYEMISGQLPFKGERNAAIATAIVNSEPPPLTSLRTGVPMDVERVVNRALSKQPDDRYQTAADLLSELRRAQRESGSQSSVTRTALRPSVSTRKARRAAGVAAGVLVAGGALAILVLLGRGSRSTMPQLTNPVQVAASIGVEGNPTWSPDGRTLAYDSRHAGNSDIWVTQVGGGPAVNRTGDHAGNDAFPRWSPDGRQIAFFSAREGGGMFVMPALGGSARKVGIPCCSAPAVWSPDGSELAFLAALPEDRVGLEIHNLRAGTTRSVVLPGRKGNQRLDLAWSPDGRFLAYVDARNYSAQVTQLWMLRLGDGNAAAISDGRMNEWSPSWSSDSRAFYFVSNRGGAMDLWMQRVKDDGTALGAERLTTGLEMVSASLSPDGRRLAYAKGRLLGNAWRVPIRPDRAATWAEAEQLTFDQAHVEMLDVSSDGQRLAVSSDRSGNPDIWILPAAGGEMQPLAIDPTPDWAPAWSPDGRELAFYAYRSGNREIWIQPVSGGPARQLTRGEAESVYPRWSPDGTSIAYQSRMAGSSNIWIIPVAGGAARKVGGESFLDAHPDWSPDGQWLAFASNRPSGQEHVWRMPAIGGQPQLVSKGPGSRPRWSADGKWVYFVSARDGVRQIWGASVDGKAERAMTNLVGQRGYLEASVFATDRSHLYFSWNEDLSDIWVLDVAAARR